MSAAGSYASRLVATAALTLVVAGWAGPVMTHEDGKRARLSKIGPAPDFTLTNQDGQPLSLASLRGKIAVATFIYASCTDTCPLLTAKMVGVQKRLGNDFGSRVCFVSVTVDPERDTSEVLGRYARAHGANLGGWAFLTGSAAQIREVSRTYGIFVKKQEGGDVDHTFLTSIIDTSGTLRVQYMGVRFDPEEMLRDIRSLLREGRER